MMPSLKGVVENIKVSHPHRTALLGGCIATMVAVASLAAVSNAYDDQSVPSNDYGQNGMSDPAIGYGGDNAAYPDGGYGGDPTVANSTANDTQPLDNGVYANPSDTISPPMNYAPDSTVPAEPEQSPQPSPTPSAKPQAVATANATAKIIINKSEPRTTVPLASNVLPATLPVTGASIGTLASAGGIAGIVAAVAYYINSRRELQQALSKR